MLTRGTRKRTHEDSFEEKIERLQVAKKKSEDAKKKVIKRKDEEIIKSQEKVLHQAQQIEAFKSKEYFNL